MRARRTPTARSSASGGDRPQRAGAVLRTRRPIAAAVRREPGPRLGLQRRPGQPVPARVGAADRRQLGEPAPEPFSGDVGHRSGRIRGCRRRVSPAGVRERPQPRLPAGAAGRRRAGRPGPSPRRLLDVARGHVRGRRTRSTPTSIHAVARLAYTEMVAAGYVAVGEFHYPHHRPDGDALRRPQRDVAERSIAAARDAGIELVLLDDRLRSAPARASRHARASAASATRRWTPIWRGWRSCAGRRPVGLAPHSVRAVSRRVAGARSRALRRGERHGGAHPRQRAAP